MLGTKRKPPNPEQNKNEGISMNLDGLVLLYTFEDHRFSKRGGKAERQQQGHAPLPHAPQPKVSL
jgi:hypothetical protein